LETVVPGLKLLDFATQTAFSLMELVGADAAKGSGYQEVDDDNRGN